MKWTIAIQIFEIEKRERHGEKNQNQNQIGAILDCRWSGLWPKLGGKWLAVAVATDGSDWKRVMGRQCSIAIQFPVIFDSFAGMSNGSPDYY